MNSISKKASKTKFTFEYDVEKQILTAVFDTGAFLYVYSYQSKPNKLLLKISKSIRKFQKESDLRIMRL